MNDKVKILQLSYGNYVSADDYFKLQSNWNSLREYVEELYNNEDGSWAVCGARYVLDKMNELEGKDKE